jgi:copper oxidase (laccase) domain-containing protein
LRAAGVHKLAIEGGCTFGDLNLFSHRRDGVTTGRLAGVIARPPVKGH